MYARIPLHFPPTQLANNKKKMISNVNNNKIYLNMYMCVMCKQRCD